MNPQLETLQKTATGLLFMSESDYPFEVVQLSATGTIEQQLLSIAQKNGSVETQTLDYFFRNAVKQYPEANDQQRQTAHRFQTLKEQLQTELKEVKVYRVGEIQVDAFIIGQLSDGSYGGLRTKLVET